MSELILDAERERALKFMEGGKNIFLTGKAGTGKSSLANHFLKTTKKKVLVLGSTGIAALNVGGQTIHSAFRIMPGMQPKDMKKAYEPWANIFKHIETILVDEQSMVRADLLDTMDRFLRLNGKDELLPMGGIQLIAVGDLCQLPPVVTTEEEKFFFSKYQSPYFFDAQSYPALDMEVIELKSVFRQKDPELVRVLNLIRTGDAKASDLSVINERFAPGFDNKNFPDHIYLATRNRVVDELNNAKLNDLSGKIECMRGIIVGKFSKDRFPADELLTLKIDARVMLLTNDRDKRWVNGDIGTVRGFTCGNVQVELPNRGVVSVAQHKWESVRQVYNKESGTLGREAVGSFTQFPLRLSWAITIHKSQGQTFENVAIDLAGGTFAHGQAYVALSRSTSLRGLLLAKKIELQDIIFDERVRAFMEKTCKASALK